MSEERRAAGKVLQITVDDGPQPVATALDGILAEIANRGVKAAFFVLGQEVEADAAGTQKIVDKGHSLGNHSWDHLEPSTANFTDAQVLDQFQRTHDKVKSSVNVTMRFWRAPRLQQISRLAGLLVGPQKLYTLSHCDIHADSKDSQGADTAAAMLAAIRADIAAQSARTNFRLLFHVKPTTASALKTVLDGLKSDGHSFTDFVQSS